MFVTGGRAQDVGIWDLNAAQGQLAPGQNQAVYLSLPDLLNEPYSCDEFFQVWLNNSANAAPATLDMIPGAVDNINSTSGCPMVPYVGYAHIFGQGAAQADQWNLGDRLTVPAWGYLPFLDTRSDAVSVGLCGAGISGPYDMLLGLDGQWPAVVMGLNNKSNVTVKYSMMIKYKCTPAIPAWQTAHQ